VKTPEPSNRQFSTTQWGVVLAAASSRDPESPRALAALCGVYWYPVYALIRHSERNPDNARDLTQGFFAELLDKRLLKVADPDRGRFRCFLRASVRNYLSHERRREASVKRGGRLSHLSLDFEEAESRWRIEPVESNTPETLFEKRWAQALLGRALARLREEADDSSDAGERFRRLEPFLTDARPGQRYAEVAAELGMTEAAVKKSVQRLRVRFGHLLRAETAQTVNDPQEVESEIRHLFTLLLP